MWTVFLLLREPLKIQSPSDVLSFIFRVLLFPCTRGFSLQIVLHLVPGEIAGLIEGKISFCPIFGKLKEHRSCGLVSRSIPGREPRDVSGGGGHPGVAAVGARPLRDDSFRRVGSVQGGLREVRLHGGEPHQTGETRSVVFLVRCSTGRSSDTCSCSDERLFNASSDLTKRANPNPKVKSFRRVVPFSSVCVGATLCGSMFFRCGVDTGVKHAKGRL